MASDINLNSMEFLRKLKNATNKNNSLLCVGLDPAMVKLPAPLKNSASPYFELGKAIIDVTADLVCAYKPNSAFYEARGAAGIEELKQVCDYLHQNHPDIPIILDFKRGDIGNTNNDYAAFAFDYLRVDAITIQPYMGQEAVQAFLDHKDKGIIVLCRTSNDGAGEFQDLETNGRKLYMQVAENVKNNWNANGNCLLVVGATAPQELADIRQLVGDEMTFLVPGIGAQGGDVAATMRAGGNNLIISSGRDIIYASGGDDFAEAARQKATETRDLINQFKGTP